MITKQAFENGFLSLVSRVNNISRCIDLSLCVIYFSMLTCICSLINILCVFIMVVL
jgi:hypothetical protein